MNPIIKAFIFDLDGVLTDTAEYHYRAWKRLADEEGIPFTWEDNERLRGISRRDSLMIVLGGRVFPEEKLQEMMERKNRYYAEFIQGVLPSDLLPGAKALLEEIRAADLKTALGSASKNANEVLERLSIRSLFDVVSDGYSVELQKPAPDLFLHSAERLGFLPSECVVVEDAAAGIEAARVGGFHVVGIGPPERVGEADVIFPGLAGVHLVELIHCLSYARRLGIDLNN